MNRMKHRNSPPSPSRVGIFWWWRGHLLTASVHVPAGVAFGGVVHGGKDHVKIWPRFQVQHPALRHTDYIHVPRGRVLYLQAEQRFIAYLDRTIATPKVKAAVLEAFALPRRKTTFAFDPHYTTDPVALDRLFDD
jgi:hypothetical protein